jgi:hypothetical protein
MAVFVLGAADTSPWYWRAFSYLVYPGIFLFILGSPILSIVGLVDRGSFLVFPSVFGFIVEFVLYVWLAYQLPRWWVTNAESADRPSFDAK